MRARPLQRERPARLYRLTTATFRDSAATGDGGLFASGRWHVAGHRVVYLASSFSLAVLERFLHTERFARSVPLVGFEIVVDASIAIEEGFELPPSWRREPPGLSTQRAGTAWLAGGSAALLRVPSRLSPFESNFLLNPLHPDAGRLAWSPALAYVFDERMHDAPPRVRRGAPRP